MDNMLNINKIHSCFRIWRVADAYVVGENSNNGWLRFLLKLNTNNGTNLAAKSVSNGNSAVNKLCANITSVSTLESVVDRVLTFNQKVADAFLTDIDNSTCTSDYLCGNIDKINVDIVNAWKTIVDNASLPNIRTPMAQDYPLLKTIVDVLTSYTSAFNFGTIGNFPAFLKTYQNRVPCNTCLSSVNNKKLANTNYDDFDKLIKNTTYGYYNFHSTIPGFSSFYAREPFSIGNPNARSGGQHMLKYLIDRNYTNASIADVDQRFGGTNPYGNKAYDVRLNTPNAENVVFIEFKSIKRKGNIDNETAPIQKVDNETDDTTPGVDGKGIDVEQLLGYLADPRTINLNSLRYVLNAKKMDPDNPINATLLARQKMQLVFKGSKSDDIFNVFWTKFKADFFPTRPNTPQGKIDARNDFNDLVNNLDNKIFGFVITN
jgi:hypothetical protein